MSKVIPFPRRPDAFKGYTFDVQIWEEDGKYLWSVCQEFEKVSGDEFEPLSHGEEDTLVAAAKAAGEEVMRTFGAQ